MDKLSILGVVLVICVLAYIQLKPYPMDYVDGVLLVDPQKMMNDTFKGCGGFLGMLLGSFIDRHYLHYEMPKKSANLAILTAVGAGILLAWKLWFGAATVVVWFGSHWGFLLSEMILVLLGMVIWPSFIKKNA